VSFAVAVKIGIEALQAASAAGSRTVYMNQTSITKDELRGGYLILYKAAASTHVFRGIIGNTASASGNNFQIFLDAGLPFAVSTADSAKVLSNPYANVSQANLAGLASFVGMPATTAAINAYLWVQTWGPLWCAPQAGVAAAALVRAVYFRHDGSLDIRANGGTNVTDQRAGFVIDYSPTGQGPPLVMLQVSP
jgi:hypothetical protein